ncbi:MAG: hypothetical protein F4234_06915 [Gammaproteobacteria bacterium]|nr:hypothetical protein [Gammaproteobacteria bacterium]MDE0480264.1 hypothetical protein [Gammaproteobacteria bacterium]MDE0507029.1 hypothetical protein [Gammaproteobacteria bacterium]MXY91244.1 hypothetical protein [Gammaproteobacteria bacterium]MYA35932.1 hypothetical protein [Gammaproteobacteria bacterium]
MHRTQILLEQEQYRLLGIEARKKGISVSALVRNLVDAHFQGEREPETDPLESIIGIGSGTGEAVGRDHNRYLYGSAAA